MKKTYSLETLHRMETITATKISEVEEELDERMNPILRTKEGMPPAHIWRHVINVREPGHCIRLMVGGWLTDLTPGQSDNLVSHFENLFAEDKEIELLRERLLKLQMVFDKLVNLRDDTLNEILELEITIE